MLRDEVCGGSTVPSGGGTKWKDSRWSQGLVADARFVRGIWLGKTTESDERLFVNELGMYTARTVKRVPNSEQKRAELVRSLQGTPWDRLAGRPAGRPRKTAPQTTPVATPPVAKETERPSEDADERRSAKAQDLKFTDKIINCRTSCALCASGTINQIISSLFVGDRN